MNGNWRWRGSVEKGDEREIKVWNSKSRVREEKREPLIE